MKTTVTVRLEARMARALGEAARRSGRSVSDLIRDALDDALTPRPVGARAGHVKGRLELPRRKAAGWRTTLRDRNWRP